MTGTRTPTIAVLGSADPVSTAVAWAVDASVADFDSPVAIGVDGVVLVVGADPAPTTTAAHGLGEDDWRRLADYPMRRTLNALQQARTAMTTEGGRIVVIVPTIGLAGSPGLVPYTTALEGIRAMTKSAARQWSSARIGVNTVAVPLSLLVPAGDTFGEHLTVAAEADDGSMIEAVVEAVLFLLGPENRHLIGTTLVVDGGSVMLP